MSHPSESLREDVVVVGAGAAGLTFALHLADHVPVTLLAKTPAEASSTYWAQGGISAVLDEQDHFDIHAADTLAAGAGLCDPRAVRYTVERAPEMVRWLAELGMPFTRLRSGAYHLTREGGHSMRRVIHAADATGRALHQTLLARAEAHPNIRILHDRVAVDLISAARLGRRPDRCLGLYALNRATGRVECIAARAVVLATGGANRVYLYSSNPDGATGDGIAIAWRAGCRVANLEFIQFHPTCLYHPEARTFLISEAVRGEGGRLLLPNGERFMPRYDPRAELAPRDIVARAIDHEMKRLGIDYVLLDISHKPAAFIRRHFPTIYARTRELGFDMTREPLPVVPAAHYTCGGVLTDLAGRTDLPGLYAIGETACTGLHGANRMASNSLLECLVFGRAAAEDLRGRLGELPPPPPLPPWDESEVTDSDEEVVVAHNWHELRLTMWNYVGIVRSDKRLARAAARIRLLKREINEYYRNFRVSRDLLELRNLATVAELIVRSARRRKESRGLHFNIDHPEPAPRARPSVLRPPPPRPYRRHRSGVFTQEALRV
ncbi:MAG: L-aspartate oxidase [Gammaproteobacteria bacterium]|nr:MAG: L-aspartate oxidase [Gammaproteobacteria bacterium]